VLSIFVNAIWQYAVRGAHLTADEAQQIGRRILVRALPRGSRLRWAGAGRVLKTLGEITSDASIPCPARSREWLGVALLECGHCHQVVERRSPVQRYCAACAALLRRGRSRTGIARSRRNGAAAAICVVLPDGASATALIQAEDAWLP
jgi:hypothetical protein